MKKLSPALSIFLAVVMLATMLASCATLPRDPEGTGVVVMSVIRDSADQGNFFIGYRLRFSNGMSLLVNPDRDYAIRASVPPGTYVIERVEAYYFDSETDLDSRDVRIAFRVNPGQVTILDSAFRVNLGFNSSGLQYQSWKLMDLPRGHRERLVERLRSDRNASSWSIR